MTQQPAWRRYVTFWRANPAEDVDDELRFHTHMRVRELVQRGLSERDARRAVAERLGDIDAAKAECIELAKVREAHARNADVLEGARADLRFALRSFARSPAWTAVALLTFALGIGATTAVFSVADSLIFRPINYPSPSRVFVLRQEMQLTSTTSVWSRRTPTFIPAWRRAARSIESVVSYDWHDVGSSPDDESARVHAAMVDSSFFQFAGARAIVGRLFTAADAVPNAPRVVVLSEGYWRRELGARRTALGSVVQLGGASYTVVGIVPEVTLPDLGLEPRDVWLPRPADAATGDVIVRLNPGVSRAAAARDLDAVARRAPADPHFAGSTWTIQLMPPGDTVKFRRALAMLAGAVALLLVVACANIAHLLLAQGVGREREIAVRYALGAGRARIIRQLLTEYLLLAVAGAACAIVVGWSGLRMLSALRPMALIPLSHVAANRRLVVVASVLAVSTAVIIGVFVALRTARAGSASALRLGAFSTRHRGRARGALVVAGIALSTTLLVGALLLIRAVVGLEQTYLGFDQRGLYGVAVSLRGSGIQSSAQRLAFAQQLRVAAARVPGVNAATIAGAVPPDATGWLVGSLETPDGRRLDDLVGARESVGADYFAVMRMSFVAGGTFDEHSLDSSRVIIGETLARRLFGTPSAVGRRFRFGADASGPAASWFTVVGVVRDAALHGVLGQHDEVVLYTPTFDGPHMALLVRVRSDEAATAAASLRALAHTALPGGSTAAVTSVEDSFRRALSEPRFAMLVLSAFATMALVLAAIGLYGVIAYGVAQRTREIGIRMTLGATRTTIARLVVMDGLRLSTVGITLGLVGAGAATRLIRHALYGISPGDPVAYACAVLSLVAITLTACLVPVRRATAIDPVLAVRND